MLDINIQWGFCFFHKKADWKTFFVFHAPNPQVISLNQYHSQNHVLNKQIFQETNKKIKTIGIKINIQINTHFNNEKSQDFTWAKNELKAELIQPWLDTHVLINVDVSILINQSVIVIINKFKSI